MIPKSVIIVGKTWKVVVNKKRRGGWFNTDKSLIEVGTKDVGKEEVMQIFFHECCEAILANRNNRYKLPYTGNDNGNYVFVFDHNKFEQIIIDFYLAIRDCLKV